MHKDGVTIAVETARRMIREQFPQYRSEAIEPLSTIGTENFIFRVGSFAAAKFPLRPVDPSTDADVLRRQAAAMTELASYCPVPTPLPIGLGHPDPAYPHPWLMQSWIEGAVATPDRLSNSDIFASDLAHLLKQLRKTDAQGRRFDGKGRGGSLRDHDRWMAACFARSETLLDIDRLQRIWAQFREIPTATSNAMSHKDLIPANLLVSGERLIGILDGGGFGPADPALDLVAAWHLLDEGPRALFRNQLGSDDLEWRRGAAWAFQQAMGLVWYYEQTNPEMSALGRNTLARIIADVEMGHGG